MKPSLMSVSLIFCTILLIICISALIVIEHQPTYAVQTVSPATGNTIMQFENQDTQQIGVLVKVDEAHMDSVAETMTAKGATVKKHRAGKVIAANVPANVVDNISNEQGVEAVLPNRQVQAFSIISDISAEDLIKSGITGDGIKVAIIDSGVSNYNTIAARDFTGSGTTADEFNHGNKIAEVILSIAPNAQIINAKVLDKNGLGSEAGIVAGINYAIEQGADIISISSGGLFDDLNSPMVAAVDDAVAQGIVVVTAAGNCGPCGECGDFKGVATPGNSRSAITVGAEDMCISPGNNYGDYIKPDVVSNGNALEMKGTSIATPFVSGAAALLLEKYDAGPAQIKYLIERNAIDLGDEGKDIVYGSGKLNLNLENVDVPEKTEEIREEVQETHVVYNTNRDITAFGLENPVTNAGDWKITNDYESTYSDFYDQTFGFLFNGRDRIYRFSNGAVVNQYQLDSYYYELNSVPHPLKILSPTEAYLVRTEDIKRFDGTNWVTEILPAHQSYHGMWWPVSGFNLVSVDAVPGIAFAAGTNYTGDGLILKRTGSWAVESGRFAPIRDVKFVNSTLAFAVGNLQNGNSVNQTIYRWNGASWTADYNSVSTTKGALNKIGVVSDHEAYAVGDKGTMMRWNGASWSDISSLTNKNIYDIDFAGSLGYAVGENTTILKYTGAWTAHSEGEAFIQYWTECDNEGKTPSIAYDSRLFSVSVISSGFGYAVGPAKSMCPGISGYVNDAVNLKLEPSAPFLSIPKLDVEQNSNTVFDLTLYSDGTSFSSSDTSKCEISGTNLIVHAGSSAGMMSCQITATKNSLNNIQTVSIEVHAAGPVSDLMIESKDIKVVDTVSEKINITVHNIGTSSASNIGVKLIESDRQNQYIGENTDVISSLADGGNKTITITRDISRGSTLTVVVDYNNNIVEYTESNNRAETKYGNEDVYLNLTVQPQFANTIRDYLQKKLTNYNFVSNPSAANVILNIGYNYGNTQKGCVLGNVYSGTITSEPHTGLIFRQQNNIFVCGARIEGLINGLKRLNSDLSLQREEFFNIDDLGALAVRDYMNGRSVTNEVIKSALEGGIETQENFILTNDGTLLRLKHYKPLVSQSFVDYLFNYDPAKPWLEPVIMAGGLWSDINAWEEAGKEIAKGVEDKTVIPKSIEYAPRDVWLIELTGGPGTDCDNCVDYTYDDVVDKYWSASVGGVLKLTGKSSAAYVGHSNGGRVALDAISRWNSLRGTTVGKLSDETPIVLPMTQPIDNYIGVGVPGNFSNPTPFVNDLNNGRGDDVKNNLVGANIYHPELTDVAARVRTLGGLVTWASNIFNHNKISLGVFSNYINYINSASDTQPGIGVSITKAEIIYGDGGVNSIYSSDLIIPVSDAIAIYNGINSPDKIIKKVGEDHIFQTTGKDVKTEIKKRLNG